MLYRLKTDFRLSIITLLAISAILGITPFAVMRFVQGNVLAGVVDLGIMLAITAGMIYAWITGDTARSGFAMALVTCISALRGYKDTSIPMLIMLFSFWGVGLPLGWVLTFTDWLLPAMGAAGFWVGLTCGLASASILLGLRLFLYSPKPE